MSNSRAKGLNMCSKVIICSQDLLASLLSGRYIITYSFAGTKKTVTLYSVFVLEHKLNDCNEKVFLKYLAQGMYIYVIARNQDSHELQWSYYQISTIDTV